MYCMYRMYVCIISGVGGVIASGLSASLVLHAGIDKCQFPALSILSAHAAGFITWKDLQRVATELNDKDIAENEPELQQIIDEINPQGHFKMCMFTVFCQPSPHLTLVNKPDFFPVKASISTISCHSWVGKECIS